MEKIKIKEIEKTREIKFRAWNKKLKRWIHVTIKNIWFLEDGQEKSFQEDWRDYENWGQFTGLKDKNGKEIYEGDIIKLFGDKIEVGEIIYYKEYLGFAIGESRIRVTPFESEELEVIGNKFENPEYLK